MHAGWWKLLRVCIFFSAHGFFFAKVLIRRIMLVDWFGGVSYPTVKEYFLANITNENPLNKEEDLYPYESMF